MLSRSKDTTLWCDGHTFWRRGLELEAKAGIGRRVVNPKYTYIYAYEFELNEYLLTFYALLCKILLT